VTNAALARAAVAGRPEVVLTRLYCSTLSRQRETLRGRAHGANRRRRQAQRRQRTGGLRTRHRCRGELWKRALPRKPCAGRPRHEPSVPRRTQPLGGVDDHRTGPARSRHRRSADRRR
jgi:hypothetical protein